MMSATFRLSKKRHIKIILLNQESIVLTYDNTSHVGDIYHQVCSILEIDERDIFGLASLSGSHYLFLDPLQRVVNIDFTYLYGKSQNRTILRPLKKRFSISSSILSSQSSAVCSNGTTFLDLIVVYFRVRFYIPVHCLRERNTHNYYYEQLKSNFLTYRLLCADEVYYQLTAFALQAELGDLKKIQSSATAYYLQVRSFLPAFLEDRIPQTEILHEVELRHAALAGTPSYAVKLAFLRLASKPNSDFNLHLYELPLMVQPLFSTWLGIAPSGLVLLQEHNDCQLTRSRLLKWNVIEKFSLKGKSFLVFLKSNESLRKFRLERLVEAHHLFALVSNMHLYQTTAQFSATEDATLSERFERGKYEERSL